MSDSMQRVLPIALLVIVLAVLTGVITFSVMASGDVPDGPVDIVWDKAPCSACGMHVGEPPFAAQLTTKSGQTHSFDDPGCLFLYLEENKLDVHQMWFRHWQQERWIAGDAVAFAPAERTPMGFGLGAVDAGEANTIDFEAARQKVLAQARGYRKR